MKVDESRNIFKPLLNASNEGMQNKDKLRSLKPQLTKCVQKEVNRWKPVTFENNEEQKSVFQVIDLFSGCGAMSLGFSALSRVIPLTEVIGGCDINIDANKSFQLNFKVPGIKKDITELVDDDIALSNFLEMMPKYKKSKPTILIGCAPCQGFTSHRKRNWSQDDKRNTLIGLFASIAVRINPECIVMENVPEMLSAKYWSHYKEAKDILEKSGYFVSASIYNTASFGVPQARFRSLVIAMKKPFLLPDTQIQDSSKFKTVKDAIGKLPTVLPGEIHPSDSLHRSAGHKESTLKTIRAIPKNGGSRPPGVGPICLDRVNGFFDVYGRLSWDRPAITITRYARNPASGRFIHPDQDRGLTMREAALLQSFPKGFEFLGSFDSVFKQIGEAVPPLFSAAVAASCVIELLSDSPNSFEKSQAVLPISEPVNNSFSSVIAGLKKDRKQK